MQYKPAVECEGVQTRFSTCNMAKYYYSESHMQMSSLHDDMQMLSLRHVNVVTDDIHLPMLVANDNYLFASVRCSSCKNKSSSHPKEVFKGLVRGEAICMVS